MVPEDQVSPSGRQRLVRWAAILGVAVAVAWLVSYILGVQIYGAAVQVTH